jgi:acetoin utilization protein AcuB
MLVKRWMSKNVITIDEDATLPDAIELMKIHDFRLLPVMRDDELIGVITDGDVKKASASEATTLEIHELLYLVNKIKIKSIMSKPAITVLPEHTVEEAADLLLHKKIWGTPVVDEHNKLVGVITQQDIFKVLIALTAHGKKGVQIGMLARDRKGLFKTIADTVRHYNGRFLNVLTLREDVPEGYRELYIRIHDMDRQHLDKLLSDLQTEAKLLFWIDHREGRRVVYE